MNQIKLRQNRVQ